MFKMTKDKKEEVGTLREMGERDCSVCAGTFPCPQDLILCFRPCCPLCSR